MDPLVSIIVPAYNAKSTLGSCLESIALQGYERFEAIIVDDGSVDGTREVAQSFADRDERFVVYSKPNGGLSSARNTGLSRARGAFVFFVDSDDLLIAGGIDALVAQAAANNSDLVFGRYETFGRAPEYTLVPEWDGQEGSVSTKTVLTYLLRQCPPRVFGFVWKVLFKRAFLLEHALVFDEQLTISEDYDFLGRCLAQKPACAVSPATVYAYRLSPTSLSSSYVPLRLNDAELVNERLYPLAKACGTECERAWNDAVANTAMEALWNWTLKTSGLGLSEVLERSRRLRGEPYRSAILMPGPRTNPPYLLHTLHAFCRMPSAAVVAYFIYRRYLQR